MIWEAEKKFIGGATLAPVQNGALFKPRCPPPPALHAQWPGH